MDLHNIVFSDFLKKVNSHKPIPSAGSSLAVTGSLGASLLGLAAKVTLRKKMDCAVEKLTKLSEASENYSKKLLNLGKEDILVYKKVIAKEKGAKEKAVEVPLEIAAIALECLNLDETIIEECHKPMKGDAWLGIELLTTCAKSAVYIALINLDFLQPNKREDYEKQIAEIEQKLGIKCSPEGCNDCNK